MAQEQRIEVFTDLDMAAVGARVRELREALGRSQHSVAWAMDVRPELLCRLERGHAPGLRVQTLWRLCQVLGVSADWLLGLRPAAAEPCCCGGVGPPLPACLTPAGHPCGGGHD